MRRVIAGVSNFTDVGDVTTLANPEIVDQIREQVQTEKRARGEAPQELSGEELEEIKSFGQTD
jgi:acetyl-CoA synthetase